MKQRKGEIDGLWLAIIIFMVVLPILSSKTVDKDGSEGQTPQKKVVNSKGKVIEVDGNSSIAPINTEVKILIKKGVAIVKKTSPDRGEPEIISVGNKHAVTSFDQTGSWSVDMYDADNFLVDWVKITVY